MSTIGGIGGREDMWSGATRNAAEISSSLGKLSSGKRINQAQDDAAGLAVATEMVAQMGSLAQASRNVNDGASAVETADQALDQTSQLLTRARELTVQAGSGAVSAEGRQSIQAELDGVMKEVDRIANSTEFNGTKLLSGTGQSMDFQVGAHGTPQDKITVSTHDATTHGLGATGLDLTSAATTGVALGKLDQALAHVAVSRANLGATGQRLDSARSNIAAATTSLAAAHAKIADVDVAAESSRLMGLQIQRQAGISTQVQANQSRGSVMRLLSI